MKKVLSLAVLLAVPLLAGCGPEKATPEDYAILQTQIQTAIQKQPLSAVGIGNQGDYIVKLEKTEELIKIANKKKTAKFLSTENPAQYVEEGYCLLNIIPVPTMKAISSEENTCYMRLFCGTAEDMNTDKMYAVELCEK